MISSLFFIDKIYIHIFENILLIKMVNGIRLEGASNFEAWKLRMTLILRKHELKTILENPKPKSNENEGKSQWDKDNTRAMELLVDTVKDHLLSIITKLDS